MAYKIDFTASKYAGRSRKKTFFRLLLVSALAGAAYGVYDVFTIYNMPTLDMKLAEYESAARPIEEMNAAWDDATRKYKLIVGYYRLLWAANPVGFMSSMASNNPLGGKFQPVDWTLATGGKCTLRYRYHFSPGDKAMQAKEIEGRLVNAVTSTVTVAGGRVDVKGVRIENLLNVEALDITAEFSLPGVKEFTSKEKALADSAKEIAAFRDKVQNTKLVVESGARKESSTVKKIMMEYLSIGKDKPDFPVFNQAIDISGWFARADKFIAANRIPGDDNKRKNHKEAWKKIGDARLPWQRFRDLDNEGLTTETVALDEISDKVRRFKNFLEERQNDYKKKLEPFIGGYDRADIFNKPLIKVDLVDCDAKTNGISRASVNFKDESGVEPAVLAKEDEMFSVTWVRWTLSLGGKDTAAAKDAEEGQKPNAMETLALENVANCAKSIMNHGPGYAIETVKIDFGEDGKVAGAIIGGLLPVKKVEAKKEAAGNVN